MPHEVSVPWRTLRGKFDPRRRDGVGVVPAGGEYLARELAAVRLARSDLVTSQDLGEHLERLEKLLSGRIPEKPEKG